MDDYVKIDDNSVINNNEGEFAKYKQLRDRSKREKDLSRRVDNLERELESLRRFIISQSKR